MSKSKSVYQSLISLGELYLDSDTKFEGVAAQITFSRNGEPRVQLKALISSVPVEHWFDAPQLVRCNGDRKPGFANP